MAVSKTAGWGFDSLRPCHEEVEMISPVEYVSQVKREMQRVTWPTQKETVGITVAVIIMVIFVMIYFFIADGFICWCLSKILGI